MRINVYSQELLTTPMDPFMCVEKLTKENIDGESGQVLTYSAVRQFLASSDRLHHPPEDDDRSAITWWLPKSADRREILARQFEHLADMVRSAPQETGLD